MLIDGPIWRRFRKVDSRFICTFAYTSTRHALRLLPLVICASKSRITVSYVSYWIACSFGKSDRKIVRGNGGRMLRWKHSWRVPFFWRVILHRENRSLKVRQPSPNFPVARASVQGSVELRFFATNLSGGRNSVRKTWKSHGFLSESWNSRVEALAWSFFVKYERNGFSSVVSTVLFGRFPESGGLLTID